MTSRATNWYSGCIAGCFSAICLQPFDVLKTYSIVSNKAHSGMIKGYQLVISKFGIMGMWRGVTPAVLRAMMGSGSSHFISNGICSGLAKTTVTILCLPISVIKVRMESPTCQAYSGVLNGVSKIYKTEGIRGFYKGLGPSVVKEIPYSSLGYAFYEKYIQVISEFTLKDRTSPFVTFLAGVLAGFTATIITQPFDVIKTKIQFQKINGGDYNNTFQATKTIYNEDGFLGFQRGLAPRLARRFFSFPLVWTLYEQMKLIS